MKRSILIVDDNPHIRCRLAESLVADSRIKIAGEAQDGLEAIQKAQELKPDLIVMDLSMPRMNGLEAARHLKKTNLKNIPIVLFTTHEGAAAVIDLGASGLSAIVSKSQGLEELRMKISSLLELSPEH